MYSSPLPLTLHVCCAPCLAAALETIRRSPTAIPMPDLIFFHNPNIHPLLEFRRRVKALQVYLERDPVSAEIDDTYGLHEFLALVLDQGLVPARRQDRCFRCYLARLDRTAELAAARGHKAISTTLLASREQDRDLVAEAGRTAAKKRGLEFAQEDLRQFLPDEKRLRGIYKQQYCGCIFSEEERYRNTNKHILHPSGRDLKDGEFSCNRAEIMDDNHST